MDNTKKANRWLSQLLHCHNQAEAIVAQVEQGQHSDAFLAHCQERLEFFAAREQVLTSRIRRLHGQLTREVAEARNRVAEASEGLLDTIYDAVKKHGNLVLTNRDDGGVEINIPPAEKKEIFVTITLLKEEVHHDATRKNETMSSNPIFSRCSLGRGRWFWVVYRSWEAIFDGEDAVATGYGTTAQKAEQAALAVVPNAEAERANLAAHYYRKLCNKRRATMPSSKGTEAAALAFLYTDWMGECDDHWTSHSHLIVKTTKKLVFVEKSDYHPDPWDRETYALNRAELEAKGEVWSREARQFFYATPWELRRQPWVSPELIVLGVKAGASTDQVKSAYRRLARQHHPDCGGDPAKFKELQEAYERAMARCVCPC